MIITCFDPGNHTGWVSYNTKNQELIGGTFLEATMYQQIQVLFEAVKPDIVVYESFNLYPGMAKHLAWNSFYPVEIIGIIKYICWLNGIPTEAQAPSIKKYAGKIKVEDIECLRAQCNEATGPFMEHTKDALLHLMYYMRNKRV